MYRMSARTAHQHREVRTATGSFIRYRARLTGVVNVSESSINIVNVSCDKPKKLIRLEPKGTRQVIPLDFWNARIVGRTVNRRDLIQSCYDMRNEVNPMSRLRGRQLRKGLLSGQWAEDGTKSECDLVMRSIGDLLITPRRKPADLFLVNVARSLAELSSKG
jgi:hypothetical protein